MYIHYGAPLDPSIQVEPYRIGGGGIVPIRPFESFQRSDFLEEAHYNLGFLPEDRVFIDLYGGPDAMRDLQRVAKAGRIDSLHDFAIEVTVYSTKDDKLFNGRVDLEKLKNILKAKNAEVHLVFLTVVGKYKEMEKYSMKLLSYCQKYGRSYIDICELCHKYKVPVAVDKARFIESLCFNELHGSGGINDILRYVDFFGETNDCGVKLIPAKPIPSFEFEMEMEAMRQVEYLLDKFKKYGIPYQRIVGNHTILIEALKMLPNLYRWQFPAQTLTCELYDFTGIRTCEYGYVLSGQGRGSSTDRKFDEKDFVRLCIPPHTYTYSHMDCVAEAMRVLLKKCEKGDINKGFKIISETDLSRQRCWFKRW